MQKLGNGGVKCVGVQDRALKLYPEETKQILISGS